MKGVAGEGDAAAGHVDREGWEDGGARVPAINQSLWVIWTIYHIAAK